MAVSERGIGRGRRRGRDGDTQRDKDGIEIVMIRQMRGKPLRYACRYLNRRKEGRGYVC